MRVTFEYRLRVRDDQFFSMMISGTISLIEQSIAFGYKGDIKIVFIAIDR